MRSTAIAIAISCLAALTLTTGVHAQCEPESVYNSDIVEKHNDVAISGNFAFAATNFGLHVYDISDPLNPMRLTPLMTPGLNLEHILVEGALAYTANLSNLIEVWDVSVPSAPQVIGSVTLPTVEIIGFDKFSNAGIVLGRTDSAATLSAVFFNDPTAPSEWYTEAIGPWQVDDRQGGVVLKNEIAFVAAMDGDLRVYAPFTIPSPIEVGDLSVPGNCAAIARAGNVVYVSSTNERVYAVDITDSNNPQILDWVALKGDYGENLTAQDDRLYVSETLDQIAVIDISAPSDLMLLGKTAIDEDRDPRGTRAQGGLLFVADFDNGLEVIDVGTCVPVPVILEQPGSIVVDAGAEATLSVVVSGGVEFQWRRDGVDLVDGGGTSGATSATLVIAAADADDIGAYTCWISNGASSIVSDAAILAVRPGCAGDVNGDGFVDANDLAVLLAAWGACG